MISSIVGNKDSDPDSLAAVLFQCLRKESSEHQDAVLDSNPVFRQKIIEDAFSNAKQLMPGITDEQWDNAKKTLARRID
jgi:hypothetical protein